MAKKCTLDKIYYAINDNIKQKYQNKHFLHRQLTFYCIFNIWNEDIGNCEV